MQFSLDMIFFTFQPELRRNYSNGQEFSFQVKYSRIIDTEELQHTN